VPFLDVCTVCCVSGPTHGVDELTKRKILVILSEDKEDFLEYSQMKFRLLGFDCCHVYYIDETNVFS
jgi:hypothetical protein